MWKECIYVNKCYYDDCPAYTSNIFINKKYYLCYETDLLCQPSRPWPIFPTHNPLGGGGRCTPPPHPWILGRENRPWTRGLKSVLMDHISSVFASVLKKICSKIKDNFGTTLESDFPIYLLLFSSNI